MRGLLLDVMQPRLFPLAQEGGAVGGLCQLRPFGSDKAPGFTCQVYNFHCLHFTMKATNSRPGGDIDLKALLKNLDDPERKRQAQERVRKFLQEKEAQEKAKGEDQSRPL